MFEDALHEASEHPGNRCEPCRRGILGIAECHGTVPGTVDLTYTVEGCEDPGSIIDTKKRQVGRGVESHRRDIESSFQIVN